MNNNNNFLIPLSVLGVSFIICAVIVSLTWKSNYTSSQTINVTGSAKKEIISDLGVLRGTVQVQSPIAGTAYKELLSQRERLVSYLASKGFTRDKIEFFPINSYPVYQLNEQGYSTNIVNSYNYTQRIEIQSTDVNKIKEISLDIASIIEQGVTFNAEMPEYHYTKLAELKIEIQAEAAKDAMIRAQKIAEATDRSLGTMTEARMGVLQITPRLSNQISDYGVNDLSSVDKEITAVVNASFIIE